MSLSENLEYLVHILLDADFWTTLKRLILKSYGLHAFSYFFLKVHSFEFVTRSDLKFARSTDKISSKLWQMLIFNILFYWHF